MKFSDGQVRLCLQYYFSLFTVLTKLDAELLVIFMKLKSEFKSGLFRLIDQVDILIFNLLIFVILLSGEKFIVNSGLIA